MSVQHQPQYPSQHMLPLLLGGMYSSAHAATFAGRHVFYGVAIHNHVRTLFPQRLFMRDKVEVMDLQRVTSNG